MSSVVDRHHVDADLDLDPDPTFHFVVDPSFTHGGKNQIFFVLTFVHICALLFCFIFVVNVIGVIIFNILERIWKFS
jgi:hypothetical protein